MMKKAYTTVLAAALLLPLSAFAQELPNRGADGESLGKDTIIKLSSGLISHGDARNLRFDDGITVSAVRWGPGEGTVWVHRSHEFGSKTGYKHFAIRVYMRQVSPGQVEFKTAAFCDIGSDKILQTTADRCDRIKNEFMDKLVADQRQDFITFIGTENTTTAQLKAAGTAIHDTLVRLTGAPVSSSGSNGRSDQVPGQID